ncbi:hypothetical protein, partial [Nocardia farcinica]|uniref:hypothetical protein n=1 Tax=Nocardia farcinica TaxID=37329 RepID=UPI001E5B7DAD
MQNEAYTLRPEDNLEFLLHSINFRQAVRELRSNNLDPFKQRIVDSATRLVRGGADFLVISSNTSHIAADEMSNDQNLWIPGGRAFPEDDRRSHRILIKTSVGALAGRHARAHG